MKKRSHTARLLWASVLSLAFVFLGVLQTAQAHTAKHGEKKQQQTQDSSKSKAGEQEQIYATPSDYLCVQYLVAFQPFLPAEASLEFSPLVLAAPKAPDFPSHALQKYFRTLFLYIISPNAP